MALPPMGSGSMSSTLYSYGYFRDRGPNLTRATDEGYAGSGTVYRCVYEIASAASALDVAVERDGEYDFDHPVARLFNRIANPAIAPRILKEIMWAQLELTGKSFAYLERRREFKAGAPDPEGLVTAVWPVFDEVVPKFDNRRTDDNPNGPITPKLLGFIVKSREGEIPLDPSEVLWLRYPDPSDPWGSVSPLLAAARDADLDGYARDWQGSELAEGGGPSGVVALGDVSDEDFNRVKAQYEAAHRGSRATGKTLFATGTGSAPYSRLRLTAQEVSLLETRRFTREQIAMAFGVPIDLLTGRTTYENRRAARTELWSETIVPKLEVVASEIDRQLLPEEADTAIFDIREVDALSESQDSKHKRIVQDVDRDLLTIDEARAEIGLEPLPGGIGQQTITAYRAPFKVIAPRTPPEPRAIEVGAREVRAAPTATSILRVYDRLEGAGARAVRRLTEKQRRVVLAAAKRSSERRPETRAHAEDLFRPDFWIDQTRDLLGGWLAEVWESGADAAADALGLDFGAVEARVAAAMEARLDVMAGAVTETTRAAVDEAVSGLQVGEPLSTLTDRLSAIFDDLEGWRAETIARTETVGGYNAASRISAVESGGVSARRWLATNDGRTRDSHAAIDGHTTAGLDDPYPNGLMFPGDPSGPSAETVNCRCVEIYVLTEA